MTTTPEAPGAPPGTAHPTTADGAPGAGLDADGARRGLTLVALGWAVAVTLGLFSYHGASPGLMVGAALVALGLLLVSQATAVRLALRAPAAVAALGGVAALVSLALAAAGVGGGVRDANAVVLVCFVLGAFGVCVGMATATERAGQRRLCLRWRRAGAVLVAAVVVTVVVALVALLGGREAVGVGFWHSLFGHELPTPLPQLGSALLALVAAATAVALALAIETTRSWLARADRL